MMPYFSGSRNLNGDAIVHFVKALCQVSKDELSGAQQQEPRMYSFNKLGIVSHKNVNENNFWS